MAKRLKEALGTRIVCNNLSAKISEYQCLANQLIAKASGRGSLSCCLTCAKGRRIRRKYKGLEMSVTYRKVTFSEVTFPIVKEVL